MFNRYNSTLGHAAISAVLLWASLPPLDLWPLAWIAPIWWILIIRKEKLQGQHPYQVLWIIGFLFWMAVLHWLRLPHWSLVFGWVSLSIYLGFYLPAFVALSRIAVHKLRIPVILAAAIVWTGLELLRAHLLSGFSMAAISHTQYRWIELIQISDLAGQYGVDFIMMLSAACLACTAPCDGKRWAFWPLGPAAAVLGTALVYGHFRGMEQADDPTANVLLVQESIDIELNADPSMRESIYNRYVSLSGKAMTKAAKDQENVDLIVWPETMFRSSLYTWDEHPGKPAAFDGTEAEFLSALQDEAQKTRKLMSDTARMLRTPLILGVDAYHFGVEDVDSFNSAVFISANGDIHDRNRYDKMHPVAVSEYIPYIKYFPWLQKLMPIGGCLTPGTKAVVFTIDNDNGTLRLMPNICYESVMSHVIRRQVNELRLQDAEPDALVNLTNDGWFWGSSELDMHLACGVFRAVECRKPLLIAANTGISAHIDGNGRIIERGPKHQIASILAKVRRDQRVSWYLDSGDWPAGICLVACIIFAFWGIANAIKANRVKRLPAIAVKSSSRSPS